MSPVFWRRGGRLNPAKKDKNDVGILSQLHSWQVMHVKEEIRFALLSLSPLFSFPSHLLPCNLWFPLWIGCLIDQFFLGDQALAFFSQADLLGCFKKRSNKPRRSWSLASFSEVLLGYLEYPEKEVGLLQFALNTSCRAREKLAAPSAKEDETIQVFNLLDVDRDGRISLRDVRSLEIVRLWLC